MRQQALPRPISDLDPDKKITTILHLSLHQLQPVFRFSWLFPNQIFLSSCLNRLKPSPFKVVAEITRLSHTAWLFELDDSLIP